MEKVTEVLLQKGRCGKYRFQVATLPFSILFPIPELGHMLETPACLVRLLFSTFGSISTVIFKAGFNSLGKTFRYCRSSLTNSYARTKFSHQYARTVILRSLHFGVWDLPLKSPPWYSALFFFRGTEIKSIQSLPFLFNFLDSLN